MKKLVRGVLVGRSVIVTGVGGIGVSVVRGIIALIKYYFICFINDRVSED
jgi:Zn-dependent alcohol dehydrogenase